MARLCCGSGRALIQAARHVREAGLPGRVELAGVDRRTPSTRCLVRCRALTWPARSVAAWEPARSFDLITCVHGLHYVGDKLALLTRAASWLTPDGRLVADLDLSAVNVAGRPSPGDCGPACGRPASTTVPAGTRSPASARARSGFRTLTSARTTGPVPATPASQPSPPTTQKSPDARRGLQIRALGRASSPSARAGQVPSLRMAEPRHRSGRSRPSRTAPPCKISPWPARPRCFPP